MVPEEITLKLSSPKAKVTSFTREAISPGTLPLRISESPACFLASPIYSSTRGRRISPSMSKVLTPDVANDNAKLIDVVVLPSPGIAEVMAITFGGFSGRTYCKLVRNCLKDSVRGAYLLICVIKGLVSDNGS